jgi:hypothetical protein
VASATVVRVRTVATAKTARAVRAKTVRNQEALGD